MLERRTLPLPRIHFFHAQHRGIDRIKSQRVDLGVARVSTQNRKRQRTEHILMS